MTENDDKYNQALGCYNEYKKEKEKKIAEIMNILEDLYPNIRPKKSPVVRVVLLHLRRRVVILLLTVIRYSWVTTINLNWPPTLTPTRHLVIAL